jgi:Integrase core domain
MIDGLRRAAEVGRFCSIRGFETKVERKLLDALAKPRSAGSASLCCWRRNARRMRAWASATGRSSRGSSWQNGCVERLTGTVCRECLDRMLIIGMSHLRRVLASYAAYYNQVRTHLALQKDAPL